MKRNVMRLLSLVCTLLLSASAAFAAAPARGTPYTEGICNTDPDVFFCEDFQATSFDNGGVDVTANSCEGSRWGNPALGDQPINNPWDICFPNGGSHQLPTITTGLFNPTNNKVWRVSKTISYTDVVTGRNMGTGNGTIAGYLKTSVLGTGAREWYMRAQVYFSPDFTWPADYDVKHALWALPRVFIDPPSAPYEAGLFVHQDFFCSGLGNFNDVPVIRYSNNFGQFPYQNEYCPPLAPGVAANGTNAPRYARNTWNTMKIHYKLGTSSATGRLRMWKNGMLVYDDARATCTGGCEDMGYLMILGWMNSADASSGYLEIDNVVYSRADIPEPSGGGGAPTIPNPPFNLQAN